jgi:hypothetical protein
MAPILCRPRSLHVDLLERAARRAIQVNPDNALEERHVLRPTRRGGPRRLAVVVGRKWPATGVRLSVSFLDNPTRALRTHVLKHLNAWSRFANVRFAETRDVGEVRIARLDSPPRDAGYWSYVGTEILEIDEDAPTMNLEGFTMRLAEEEFRRVVRHEAGHTLGFDHEHMRSDIVKRIDPAKAIAFYREDQGWTRTEVEAQVLTPLSKRSIMGTTEADELSIMCYHLPAEIMRDGNAVTGGDDINATDRAFASRLYPKPAPARSRDAATAGRESSRPPVVAAPVGPGTTPVAGTDRGMGGDADAFHLVILDGSPPAGIGAGTGTGTGAGAGAGAGAAAPPKPKFAQVLAIYGGARVLSSIRLRADKGEPPTAFNRIIGMHERIRKFTNLQEGMLPDDAALLDFGSDLFETLLQGDVRRLYDEARSRQHRERLELVLTSMIPWIAEKPWEFGYDRSRRSFLATEDVHFVRNVLTAIPSEPVTRVAGPLRILVAAAQPLGSGQLSADAEIALIRRGFETLVAAGAVQIEVLPRATPGQLHGTVSSGAFQVVHFIGHGVYDETRREGCLVFEDDAGGEILLGERKTREILVGRGLNLVFLNACESGRGGRADFNKGTAQSLVAHGLPAVVANQYSVLDVSATSFARHFYWALSQGDSLGQAAREARIAVNYAVQGELIDWAVPVLFARDSRLTLCARAGSRAPYPTAAAAVGSRRGTGAAGRVRVAVLDVDAALPGLERALKRMNETQDALAYRVATTSLPLDVWEPGADGSGPWLRAAHAARRMRNKPAELGVDLLACLTRRRLRDDDGADVDGWYPTDPAARVRFCSLADMGETTLLGNAFDRALATVLASIVSPRRAASTRRPR